MEGTFMTKTASIFARVEPGTKEQAEQDVYKTLYDCRILPDLIMIIK